MKPETKPTETVIEEEPEKETDLTPLRAEELAISEALKKNMVLPVEHRPRKVSEKG